MIKVSLVSSADRGEGVAESLRLFDSEVDIPDRPVMVKPNSVSTSNQLAATHVDTTRATLEYLAGKGVRDFVVAVGPAIGTPDSGFDNYGYRALSDGSVRTQRRGQNNIVPHLLRRSVHALSALPVYVRVQEKTSSSLGYRTFFCSDGRRLFENTCF
jgi:hypothetical protein